MCFLIICILIILGPYKWKLCLQGQGSKQTTKQVPHNLNKDSHSVTYEELKPDSIYTVCVQIGAHQSIHPVCNNPKQPLFECQTANTTCSILPPAEKLPVQTNWVPSDKFNPFTQIKVRMESGTFDGSSSGLRNFSFL